MSVSLTMGRHSHHRLIAVHVHFLSPVPPLVLCRFIKAFIVVILTGIHTFHLFSMFSPCLGALPIDGARVTFPLPTRTCLVQHFALRYPNEDATRLATFGYQLCIVYVRCFVPCPFLIICISPFLSVYPSLSLFICSFFFFSSLREWPGCI